MAAGMEQKITVASGLAFAAIAAGKLRRYSNQGILDKLRDLPTAALNARDMTRVVRGFGQSRKILQEFDPDIVFIKGGYVGLPVGLAARSLRIPYVIHESDMRPGLANKILAKHAAKVAVGFPTKLYKEWQQDQLVYTGNPIRREILSTHRLEGLAKFKLSADLPVILVFCGSQGSQAVNEAVLEAAPELTKRYQIIHVTGERNIEDMRFKAGRLELAEPLRYQLHSFLGDTMAAALAAADLVIGRGGANTFSELAVLGKPAIIVPHPSLTDQTLNATTLARAGAIKVLPQDRLSKHSLISQVDQILESDKEQEALARAIAGFALPDAADKLASLILRSAPERTKTEQNDEASDGHTA
jgi:UDP-N-acetylglucosamine--N-acetylmuramyl-(pentapeptide) pyrophosphoryl-undecaprenol N-acetylglucosamine transferase